ncbi:Arginine transport ATP-binding protein ArtM [bioreactor metagenome]|uniref:Arginine transport ATP-binding protein ArtM n=1 Tax=bioreactor metagenome TaxID=1076179 RepID=A0A645EYE7_9ZZZZ
MFPLLTVREHVIYFLKAYDKPVNDEMIDKLFDRFDLLDKQDKMGNELSKGMMQKVSICCALAVDPKVLIFDEPMVGLDPKAIKELKSIILELKEAGKIVLISTHMLEMVESLWDQVILMDKGKMIGSYDKESMGAMDLEELFFKKTGDDHE